MKFINNISTDFSVKINKDTWEYVRALRNTFNRRKEVKFSGVIWKLSHAGKIGLEAIPDYTFLDKGNKDFYGAYNALLPGFTTRFLV